MKKLRKYLLVPVLICLGILCLISMVHVQNPAFAAGVYEDDYKQLNNSLETIIPMGLLDELNKIQNTLNGINTNKKPNSPSASEETKPKNPNRQGDKTLNKILLKAVEVGDIDMANTALHKGANPNYTEESSYSTPFLLAIGNKNFDMVNLLINYGADINMRLYVILFEDNTPLLAALSTRSFDMVRLIVEKGAFL